ncbi:hypothetical protein GCM10010233_44490 [Streptomyces pseudogriseolus]|uniref:Secreted protein n=1 Tax=Streptomyces pseudogriseolus TaxID=36817 RepID=A0ABQ2T9U6_STREZ|nr:hypothetical protein GCM10010233_44490 [Streptomyces gancidicus]GGS54509.1 hypothetical protein GCM10010285_37650 [Streptomyces rubiginosus]
MLAAVTAQAAAVTFSATVRILCVMKRGLLVRVVWGVDLPRDETRRLTRRLTTCRGQINGGPEAADTVVRPISTTSAQVRANRSAKPELSGVLERADQHVGEIRDHPVTQSSRNGRFAAVGRGSRRSGAP